jgi:hypothetical protein
MINKSKLIYKDQVATLCNIMLNTQALVEDLETMEEEGLFKFGLKNSAKDFQKKAEASVNQIYGAGHQEILKAEKEGRPEEEIQKLMEQHKVTNMDITRVYEAAVESRKLFDSLTFEEKLNLTTIITELRKQKKL